VLVIGVSQQGITGAEVHRGNTDLAQARQWWQALDAGGETRGLIAALQGRYRPTAYGGDPVRNPDALPPGRNLYGFDPSRVPTRHAWEAGKQAAEKLIAAHRQRHGRTPAKLAVSLWSVETMRHQGLLEAQALWLMGVEPVWDEGGRVIDAGETSATIDVDGETTTIDYSDMRKARSRVDFGTGK